MIGHEQGRARRGDTIPVYHLDAVQGFCDKHEYEPNEEVRQFPQGQAGQDQCEQAEHQEGFRRGEVKEFGQESQETGCKEYTHPPYKT